MVSSRTLMLVVVAGAAIAGLAYFTYQYTFSDTLGGQLARSRLGIDKLPPPSALVNPVADPSKPLSSQPKDPLLVTVDEILQNFSRTKSQDKYKDGILQLPNVTIPTSHHYQSKAGYSYNLSQMEEEYEPWARY